jgi:predicted dehydrogenase
VAQAVHLPLLSRRWDLFEVAAVADLSPSLRDAVGSQYGVPPEQRFGDVTEMIKSSDADAVLLLTSGSHGGAALAALEHDVAVFCEKPLAFTVAEADALAAAESRLGRQTLALGYMKEHDPAVRRLADLLGGVRDVRAVDVTVLHPTGESQLAFANLRPAPADVDKVALQALRAEQDQLLTAALGPDTSRYTRDLYANIVLGSMVHDTSLLRALFGGLTAVTDARAWPDDTMPPSVEVTGELNNGARARIAWHYLPDYPEYHETLVVRHATGSLSVTFGTPYVVNSRTKLEVVETVAGGVQRSTWSASGEAFENELVDFYLMMTACQASRSGIAEGRDDIVTSQHIMRALADAQGIQLGGEAGA